MTCQIKNSVTRPNGPYGDVMLQGYCATHDFRVFEGSIHGKLCPIGQIEAATAKALAQISAKTGPEPARDDPPALTTTPDPNPNTHTVSQRPRRKPKPTEE